MTVTTSLLATGAIRSLGDQSTKLSAVLNNRAVDDTRTVPDRSLLASNSTQVDANPKPEQYPPLNLRLDTLSLAIAGTNTDGVDSTVQQVTRLLAQLQTLASRASLGGMSAQALELISGQFQALRLSIGNVQPSPPRVVPVASLLEAVPGGLESPLGQQALATNLTVGGVNDEKALLGDINIATVDAAKQALGVITRAIETVDAERVLVARVKEAIDFAAASTEGALANQEALRSTLTEGDLNGTADGKSLIATLQAQSENARLVQTSRLPNNVLQLLA